MPTPPSATPARPPLVVSPRSLAAAFAHGLHRVKDVSLGEDQSLIHQGQGPPVMALLRDAAISLLVAALPTAAAVALLVAALPTDA